jgi:16S rRNA (guanine1207-N2)-methyltransferase
MHTYQSYDQPVQFIFKIGGEEIEVISKPGLPDWDKLLPSTLLLALNARLHKGDNVLLIGSHQGALGIFLARHLIDGKLTIMDNSYIALQMTDKTMALNDIQSVNLITSIDLPVHDHNLYNSVLVQIPKGRKLARRWLIQAYYALIDGGYCYIAGSNNLGIQSIIKDACELFGTSSILAYKKGNRIAQLVKNIEYVPLPDWVYELGIAPYTWVEFSILLSDYNFQIRSLPGVFSYDSLDEGTSMLLSVCNIPIGARVLDMGCGYGIIGMFAAHQGADWVDLIDSDLLAISACKATLKQNQITNTAVILGDLLSTIGTRKYDLILSNPPFHAGKAVDYQIASAMIQQSFRALLPDGQIVIVANRFIQYDELIKQTFGNVAILASSGKFHVLCGRKTS